ncbi:hypothetical protein AC578_3892 [Pseudocercospora eumusae]|uniref:Heterokaryon incompatibility domain-containing protein n=1 Tax=Pseudocercospora eumusae TaxID=321146 RepID=A0A139GY10_9PEZI|nr:hypothetical protein AC578_3892 [Pseudocercospora eumusae]
MIYAASPTENVYIFLLSRALTPSTTLAKKGWRLGLELLHHTDASLPSRAQTQLIKITCPDPSSLSEEGSSASHSRARLDHTISLAQQVVNARTLSLVGAAPLRARISSAAQRYRTDSFRLLRLLRGAPNSDLKGNLKVRRLQHEEECENPEPEPYDALSYNWGPQEGHKFIEIIESSNVYPMPIGPNLDAALRQFRSEHEEVFLWVDALCIDQSNLKEKGVQIPLMRYIYNHAQCVRVWLGGEADGSSHAMDFVEGCLDLSDFDKRIVNVVESPHWAALSALIRRPWFTRRWIIQEVGLAKEAVVHCGDKHIEWRKFASVITMLARAQPQLRKLFRESAGFKNHPDYLGDLSELGAIRLADLTDNLFRRMSDRTITGRHFTLEALMSSLGAFEASEPKDVLYAILWLANDAHPVAKSADTVIEQSLTVPLEDTPTLSPVAMSFPEDATFQATFPLRTDSDPKSDAGADDLRPPDSTQRARALSEQSRKTQFEMTVTAPMSELDRVAQSTVGGSVIDAKATLRRSSQSHDEPQSQKLPVLPQIVTAMTQQTSPNRPRRLSVRSAKDDKERKQAAGDHLRRRLPKIKKGRIVVDYGKEILEVYKDFLELAISQSKSIDILCMPWAPTDQTLPSWIPQMNRNAFGLTSSGVYRRVNADPLVKRPGHLGRAPKPYDAARGRPANWMIPKDGRSIFVEGMVLDKIKQREKPAWDGIIPDQWMQAVGWDDQKHSPPERFWRTLVGNIDSAGNAAPIHWEIACKYAFAQRAHGGSIRTSDLLLDCPSTVSEFLERVQCVVWSRRLAKLEHLGEESLCLAPGKAKKGDFICILYGCSVPVVLRPYINGIAAAKRISCQHAECPTRQTSQSAERTKVHYEFIGECYVHGMMGGEAFNEKRNRTDYKIFDVR